MAHFIILPEAFSKPLDLYTDDNKVIQSQPLFTGAIFAQQILHKCWSKSRKTNYENLI